MSWIFRLSVKIRYNNLCIWLGTWKVRRLNQSRSRKPGEIPGWARRKERLSLSKFKWPFLTDSDAELLMYLIPGFRFGSWKVRRLNWALVYQELCPPWLKDRPLRGRKAAVLKTWGKAFLDIDLPLCMYTSGINTILSISAMIFQYFFVSFAIMTTTPFSFDINPVRMQRKAQNGLRDKCENPRDPLFVFVCQLTDSLSWVHVFVVLLCQYYKGLIRLHRKISSNTLRCTI